MWQQLSQKETAHGAHWFLAARENSRVCQLETFIVMTNEEFALDFTW